MIAIHNPATLAHLADVPSATPAEIDSAVAAAQASLDGPWQDPGVRKAALADIADIMERETEALAHILTLEQGKPLATAWMELATAIRIARHYAAWDDHVPVIRDTPGERVWTDRIPLGVAGMIVPWNFPITILMMKLGPGLRAGNTVVVKPSPSTPLATLRLAELIAPVLPVGVLNVVTGDAGVGAALCAHPGIAKLSFTGSTPTGRRVMASCAPTLKRLTLELGGNDPAIVFADADIPAAARRLAMTVFSGAAGQICQACKRVYVERPAHAEMVAAFEEIVQGIRVGDGTDAGVMMGPLHTAGQRDFVGGLLDDARARKARVFQDGPALPDLPGHFMRPAVVSGIAADAPLVMQEQFGPALPIVPFDTEAEALAMANSGELGLDASVWSADEDRALAFARRIRAGSLFINTHAAPPDPEIPFGGAKQSGFGAELGDWGIDDASQRRVLKIERQEAG